MEKKQNTCTILHCNFLAVFSVLATYREKMSKSFSQNIRSNNPNYSKRNIVYEALKLSQGSGVVVLLGAL